MNKDFYPTPDTLIRKMVSKINSNEISTILEPSAGKGDICDYIKPLRRSYSPFDIDCIEIEKDLQFTLKGKGYRVVHDDFITFNTDKRYDLILANFPFSEGDRHLLKAIELQKRNGGQIVCLVNAETIKNPYSKIREYLLAQLKLNNAEIEYLQEEFTNAERKTDVEVALINVTLKKEDKESILLTHLKNEIRETKEESYTEIVETDPIKSLISQYNLEIKIGASIISEQQKLKRYFSAKDSSESLIKIKIKGDSDYMSDTSESGILNRFICEVRYKYWSLFLRGEKITNTFPSKIREELYSKLTDLKNYDFTEYNINTIFDELGTQMNKSIEDTILALFEELSHQYSYGYQNKEYEKNVHYFSGWKSNKSWKINDRVIIPFYAISNYDGKIETYKVENKMTDILKCLNFLEKDLIDVNKKVKELINAIEYNGTANLDFHYFTVTFYKKGTCHIKWKNKDLLDKLNIFGSQKKGWLPPSYGKKTYSEMTQEERQVINEFQGEEEYNKILQNKDYFLEKTTLLLN